MASKRFWFLLILIFISDFLLAQQSSNDFSLLFYNVENLFDVKDDSLTADESFTPEGDLHWTYKRLDNKCLKISKAVAGAGGWKLPDVIVLCEVENRYVIDKLLSETPLKSLPYRVIHKESPDHRGIDVALIYNQKTFFPIEYHYYPLFENGKPVKTRELLYVSGTVTGGDTLHIFGNHWPSRYSGFLETQGLRNAAAKLLRNKIYNLNLKLTNPKIVVVGDFNENPDDRAIIDVLKAEEPGVEVKNSGLYNLFSGRIKSGGGTLKYQSQWFLFDQIMISGAILKANNGISSKPDYATIADLPFLLENDEKFGGKKPFRTYYGFEYHGGFSDHLPVIIRFNIKD